MKIHTRFLFLFIAVELLVCVSGQSCSKVCIPISSSQETSCSTVRSTQHYEVRQPGSCDTEAFVQYGYEPVGRHAICCTGSDAFVQYILQSKQDDIISTAMGAEEAEFPHQVHLILKRGAKEAHCGGTVYNKNYIITASHCVHNNFTNSADKPEDGTVVAGITNLDKIQEDNKYPVAEVFMHPRYNPLKIADGFDIALIKLAKPLSYEGGKIRPLRLPKADFEPDYKSKGIVIGWGKTEGGRPIKQLLKTWVPLHDAETCQRIAGEDQKYYYPLDHQLCVAGATSGITVGEGDSGGPVICPDKDSKPVLCGIASYKSCKNSCKAPSVYIKPASFVDWINKKTMNEPQETPDLFEEPIGGHTVDPEEYLVRIFGKRKNCGGVLLAANVILTAGSCFKDNREAALVVVHGKSKSKLSLSGAAILHSEYDEVDSDNVTKVLKDTVRRGDITLFKLKEPFRLHFYPELPPPGYKVKDAVEIAWSQTGRKPETRNYKEIPKSQCQKSYDLLQVRISDDQLCAVETYTGGSTCDREIGSPLICEGRYVCGVASFRGCRYSFPNIFSNVEDMAEDLARWKNDL